MIYTWSKIIAWFTFWLNITEIQPPKYIRKNRTIQIFYILTHFLRFIRFVVYEKHLCNYYLYIIYFIFCSSYHFNNTLVGFWRSILSYQNASWKRLGSIWLVLLILQSGKFSVQNVWAFLDYFGLNSPFSRSVSLILVM